jgi:hypothetical protein
MIQKENWKDKACARDKFANKRNKIFMQKPRKKKRRERVFDDEN